MTIKLRNLKLLIAKTPLLLMIYFMNWLTYELWTRTGGWKFDYSDGIGTSSPLIAGREISTETCGLDDVFPPDDLCFCPETLCWYICIYICMHSYNSCFEYHLLFSLVSPIMSCSMMNRLVLGWLWPLVSAVNNILTLAVLYSAVSHLPGWFCPWTFFNKNIGFNMVSSEHCLCNI